MGPAFKSASDHDTVGAVCLDKDGNLAYATSTGGINAKHPGRVGDSPIGGELLNVLLKSLFIRHINGKSHVQSTINQLN